MSVNKPTFYTSFHGRKPDFIFAEHTLPAGAILGPGSARRAPGYSLAASGRWAAFADRLLLATRSLAEAQTRPGGQGKTGDGAA
jgi:hypothetical protein